MKNSCGQNPRPNPNKSKQLGINQKVNIVLLNKLAVKI